MNTKRNNICRGRPAPSSFLQPLPFIVRKIRFNWELDLFYSKLQWKYLLFDVELPNERRYFTCSENINICVYVYMYVCVCVHIIVQKRHVCVYIYMYIYRYTYMYVMHVYRKKEERCKKENQNNRTTMKRRICPKRRMCVCVCVYLELLHLTTQRRRRSVLDSIRLDSPVSQ